MWVQEGNDEEARSQTKTRKVQGVWGAGLQIPRAAENLQHLLTSGPEILDVKVPLKSVIKSQDSVFSK
ncbi:unnamed protein product [Menidia menidia]|uniref:(Atlantic silverside) hypothetical protein n=1 Tax=Menidia menidia TaxID=238744 RepID=A0A8S4C391_9TELE|nr:unnamed protein product [Menidia menidia]